MVARLLDGKRVAAEVEAEVAQRVTAFRAASGIAPCLVALLVGDDPASLTYVKNKQLACKRVGIDSRLIRLHSASTLQVIEQIAALNADPAVHGILVQLPLPSGVDTQQVLDAVHPLKDVDAFHPENVGLLAQGRPRFLPCTPAGILRILVAYQLPVAGRHVVIVGRSDIVGRPAALLFSQRTGPFGPQYANATVTLCHRSTVALADWTRAADVLVVAAGRPMSITADMLPPEGVVIDVGIHRTQDGLVGDVDAEAARRICGFLTPVPGGVGPMTVAMLLANTIRAAELISSR
jgi:methylenetetrahydrofolate dehydrogenase (NADP+)/methenyltetrahydrofolate cyclohydrolase